MPQAEPRGICDTIGIHLKIALGQSNEVVLHLRGRGRTGHAHARVAAPFGWRTPGNAAAVTFATSYDILALERRSQLLSESLS